MFPPVLRRGWDWRHWWLKQAPMSVWTIHPPLLMRQCKFFLPSIHQVPQYPSLSVWLFRVNMTICLWTKGEGKSRLSCGDPTSQQFYLLPPKQIKFHTNINKKVNFQTYRETIFLIHTVMPSICSWFAYFSLVAALKRSTWWREWTQNCFHFLALQCMWTYPSTFPLAVV